MIEKIYHSSTRKKYGLVVRQFMKYSNCAIWCFWFIFYLKQLKWPISFKLLRIMQFLGTISVALNSNK